MNSFYLVPIILLLPLGALMVVVQNNPYNALVMRGILGAISALTYAVLGAADVSLTDALVGTMLSITLYAIAVRSSLNMRIGGVKLDKNHPILSSIKDVLKTKFVRLEVVSYDEESSLDKALYAKEIHSAYVADAENKQLLVRVPRLYELLSGLPDLEVILVNQEK